MPVVFVYDTLMAHPAVRKHGLPAYVRDHALRFQTRGTPLLEPRFLGLTPEPGARAYGVVVEINDKAWARMKRHGVGLVFEDVVAVVDEQEVDARAFVLRRTDRAPEAWPSVRYARKVLEGAQHHGLPDEVLDYYRQAVEHGTRWTAWLSWGDR